MLAIRLILILFISLARSIVLTLGFVFRHGVLFVLDGWLGERIRLWLLLFFFWVLLDGGWLDRVIARIALFKAVTDVHTGAFPTL